MPDAWVQAHPEAPFTFVTDGLAAAIEVAREIAGDRDVGVTAGALARQALELGLRDEIAFDLVPVRLGGGTLFFDGLAAGSILLDGPWVVQGTRVTHLRHIVRRSAEEQASATTLLATPPN